MCKKKLKRELSEEIKSVKKIMIDKCENNNVNQKKDKQKKLPVLVPVIGKRKDFMLVKYNKLLNEKSSLQRELASFQQKSNFKIKTFENVLALKENEIHSLTCEITDLKEKLKVSNARETQATQTDTDPEVNVVSNEPFSLPENSFTILQNNEDVYIGIVTNEVDNSEFDVNVNITKEVDNSEHEKTSSSEVVSVAEFEKLKEENQLLQFKLLRATIEKMALKRENFQLSQCQNLPYNPFHEMDLQEV